MGVIVKLHAPPIDRNKTNNKKQAKSESLFIVVPLMVSLKFTG